MTQKNKLIALGFIILQLSITNTIAMDPPKNQGKVLSFFMHPMEVAGDDIERTETYRISKGEAANVVALDLTANPCISDAELKYFTSLEKLNLSAHWKRNHARPTTDEAIRDLITLTDLDLRSNNVITLEGLTRLTNLQTLILGDGTLGDGTDSSGSVFLSRLPHLRRLDVAEYDTMQLGVHHLTNLTSLTLGKTIPPLPFLKELTAFKNLQILNLGSGMVVRGSLLCSEHLSRLGSLIQLRELTLGYMRCIDRQAIPDLNKLSTLTNLVMLNKKIISPESPLSSHLEVMRDRWTQAYAHRDANPVTFKFDAIRIETPEYPYIHELCVLACIAI